MKLVDVNKGREGTPAVPVPSRSMGLLLVPVVLFLALFYDQDSGRLRLRPIPVIGVLTAVGIGTYCGIHWGKQGVILFFIALFWLTAFWVIGHGMREDKRKRALLYGEVKERRSKKVTRALTGCALIPVGLVLMFVMVILVEPLRVLCNPHDESWIDVTFMLVAFLPGLFVAAMGTGMLFHEPIRRPRTEVKGLSEFLVREIKRGRWPILPFTLIGLAFMWVVDKYRFIDDE